MKHISEFQKHEAFIKHICGYSPQELANELNVHFTTVYRWISDWQKNLLCRKLTDLSIKDIGEIMTYTEELRQQLIETGKKRIIRLMQRMGLYSKSADRPYYPLSNAGHLEDTYDVQILQ